MKVGDLVKYYGSWTHIGVVLCLNDESGTVKVHRQLEGDTKWWVTSGCRVIKDEQKEV
tara:strand:+ start:831 stop:1004 length:174 start_codon:yes stop_codon:yes gene_type:complete